MNRNCFLPAPDETMLSVVHRTLKMFRNSQSDPLWSKIDPLRAQIDPLWSQTRGTLARLQKQNTNKMSYSLEKSKKAVSLLRVMSSPEQYVCFFNFNFGLFSYLLSFSYRFYLPYFLDLANCSREGTRAIVKKYLYPVHKNKLDLRDLFSYIPFPNLLLSSLYLGLFSNLLSFSYRFYLPYVLDLSKCVKVTEFCSQKGIRAIAVLRNSNTKYVNLICHKLVCTFHNNKLASRKLFPYIPVLNLQFSLNFTECVKYKYRMKFIAVLETLFDKSQHMVSLPLTKGDGGRDVYVTYLHQVDLHENNWRKTVRQRERGYKAYKSRSREPSRINLKKILKSMKKRVLRRTRKLTLRNLSPPSSRLRSIAANYKTYYVMHKYRNDCFFSKFHCKHRNTIKVVSLSTAAKNKEIKNSSFDKISSSGGKILKRYPIISYSNSFFLFKERVNYMSH